MFPFESLYQLDIWCEWVDNSILERIKKKAKALQNLSFIDILDGQYNCLQHQRRNPGLRRTEDKIYYIAPLSCL